MVSSLEIGRWDDPREVLIRNGTPRPRAHEMEAIGDWLQRVGVAEFQNAVFVFVES